MGFRSEHCAEQLIENGFWAYYSSETARDMLLRNNPWVINILTNADLFQLSKLFPDIQFKYGRRANAYLDRDGIPVHFFVSDFPVEDAVKIPGMIELEKDVLKQAIGRELFRVNSFFYDLRREVFHDPLDTYAELKKGIIQTIVSPEETSKKFPTFALKTAQIFSDTGFTIEKNLKTFLDNHDTAQVYRIQNEDMISDFLCTCTSKRAAKALILLDEWGVLEVLLPEVSRLKWVYHDKDHHPEGNAFWHTIRCLECVKKPYKNLMMAILLHDTGKAETMHNGNGIRFPHHSTESRKIADCVLRRFHFDQEDRNEILFLVENHMVLNWIDRLPVKAQSKILSSPYFPNLLELYRADIESGYHNVKSYYRAARLFRSFKRKMRLKEQGIYL